MKALPCEEQQLVGVGFEGLRQLDDQLLAGVRAEVQVLVLLFGQPKLCHCLLVPLCTLPVHLVRLSEG
jgi:hypothetical protein